jgi:hypothetical protein
MSKIEKNFITPGASAKNKIQFNYCNSKGKINNLVIYKTPQQGNYETVCFSIIGDQH